MSEGAAAGRLEEPQVRAMFDRIASVYDLMNSVMTAGLHHRWRKRAADLAAVGAGDRALDVATGTGDLAVELKRRVARPGPQKSAEKSFGARHPPRPALRGRFFPAPTAGVGATHFPRPPPGT